MPAKELVFGADARAKLKRGVDQAKYGSGAPSVIEYLVVIDFEGKSDLGIFCSTFLLFVC